MPALQLKIEVTIVYNGSVLTEEQKQQAADAAAQAAADSAQTNGKGIVSQEGVTPEPRTPSTASKRR